MRKQLGALIVALRCGADFVGMRPYCLHNWLSSIHTQLLVQVAVTKIDGKKIDWLQFVVKVAGNPILAAVVSTS
jgi:hypothetical protein